MVSSKIINTKLFFTISALLLLIFTSFPIQLHASKIGFDSTKIDQSSSGSVIVNILSAEPSTGAITTLEASGTWRNSCIPELDSIKSVSSETGSGLLIIAATAERADSVCEQVETNWIFPVDVLFDSPGLYTIQLSIASEQLDATDLYASKDVLVAGHLSFTPQTPQVDQPIMLTVTGLHSDGCVPEYISHEIVDGTIAVELMTPDPFELVCGQSITPWHIDVDVIVSNDGEYAVEIYHSAQYEGVAVDRTLYKTDTISVGVRAAQVVNNLIYLPNIIQSN